MQNLEEIWKNVNNKQVQMSKAEVRILRKILLSGEMFIATDTPDGADTKGAIISVCKNRVKTPP